MPLAVYPVPSFFVVAFEESVHTHQNVDALLIQPPGLTDQVSNALKGKSADVQDFGLDIEIGPEAGGLAESVAVYSPSMTAILRELARMIRMLSATKNVAGQSITDNS